MKKVKITVMKITTYEDLIEKYENPIEHACHMKVGYELYKRMGFEEVGEKDGIVSMRMGL